MAFRLRRMRPGPTSALRLARPSRDLDAAERFWVDGLGLEVLWRSASDSTDPDEADEPDLLMVGWPDAGWHLELVGDPEGELVPTPTDEDLLVLYVDGPVDEDLVRQLIAAGGSRVQSRNPYWEQWGITIADPDGYRLVLCARSWA